MKRFLLPLGLFLALASTLALGLKRVDPQALPSPLVGRPVPAFNLTQLDAPQQRITEAPCRREPDLGYPVTKWCVSPSPKRRNRSVKGGIIATTDPSNFSAPPGAASSGIAINRHCLRDRGCSQPRPMPSRKSARGLAQSKSWRLAMRINKRAASWSAAVLCRFRRGRGPE